VAGDGAVAVTTWKELAVGDVILIRNDDEVPADVAVLACGGIQGPICYVETAAIDGETNLKIKVPALPAASTLALALSDDHLSVTGLPLLDRTVISAEAPNSEYILPNSVVADMIPVPPSQRLGVWRLDLGALEV
jgi:magnesium-transporting ATPase (P-type)